MSKPRTIKSTCIYCGCGCQLNFEVEGDKIIKVSPVSDDPVSQGKPCIKGLTLNELDNSDRLTFPMIRKNDKLEKAGWEEAIKHIYEKIKDLGPKEIAYIGSGEFTNEDNFILAKFARLVSKTSNIDCCARLCHASTTTAMRKIFGNPAMPNYMEDIVDSDLIITTGTNPPSNYPVVFNRIMEAKKKGAKIVCIDIEISEMSRFADIFIPINFTEITTLYGGIIKKLIEDDKIEEGIQEIKGFEDLVNSIEKFNEKYVLEKCQIGKGSFNNLYDLVVNSKKPIFMHGMGVTQHANGTNNIIAILNTAILKRAKIIPMRGKINVQGSGDMGACRDWVLRKEEERTEDIWPELLNDIPGHHLTKFAYNPEIKVIIIMGGNPAQSMPDLNRLYEEFKNKFIVYIHHHPGKTFEFADVVIPAPLLFENEGTITNGERRVIKVNPINSITEKIIPTWRFLSDLAKLFGKEKEFSYKSPDEIFEEIKKTIPAYSKLEIEDLKKHNNNFADKEKKFEQLLPIDNTNPERIKKSEEYPLLLTTQRSVHHFCTGELTRRNKKLIKFTPHALCEINDKDAKEYGIKNGEKIEIESHKDKVEAVAKVSPDYQKGTITLPFHFEDCLVNKLFDVQLDPISKEPNLKAVWVRIKKLQRGN